MTKRTISVNSYNAMEYWDTTQIKSGLLAGTLTAIIDIPAHSFVQDVIAMVEKPLTQAGTASFTVGDSADADGFLITQQMDESAGTVFGNDAHECGVYLLPQETFSEEFKTKPEYQHIGKYYKTPGQIVVTATLTVAPTVEGSIRIWAKILTLVSDGA